MLKKISLSSLMIYLHVFCYCQNNIQWNDTLNIIYAYGLEEKNTITLIDNLSKDTNNLIIIDYNFLTLKKLIDGKDPNVEDFNKCMTKGLLNNIYHRNNIFGFKDIIHSNSIPLYYLKEIDSLKFKSLLEFLKTQNIEVINNSVEKLNISNQQQSQIQSKIQDLYLFNDIEMKFFNLNIFQNNINPLTLRNYLNTDKRCFYFYDYYLLLEGDYKSEINKIKITNKYIFICKKGVKDFDYLHFRNRMKSKKLENYDLLEFSDLPKKIYLSYKEYFTPNDIKGYRYLYIKQLDECK